MGLIIHTSPADWIEKSGARADKSLEALEAKIDRHHAEIMHALHKLENSLRNQIEERLARVENKLQMLHNSARETKQT